MLEMYWRDVLVSYDQNKEEYKLAYFDHPWKKVPTTFYFDTTKELVKYMVLNTPCRRRIYYGLSEEQKGKLEHVIESTIDRLKLFRGK